jgi:predicted phosphodiesterase
MKIQILSDLHDEISHTEEPFENPGADVLVLAGDIDRGDCGIRQYGILAQEMGIPCIYVAGNHEYYGSEYGATLELLRKTAQEFRVHFLERDAVVIDGVRFLGATLWTDFAGLGNSERERAMTAAARYINDYRRIAVRAGNRNRVLRPKDTKVWHAEARQWFQDELARDFPGPTVVVTHHGPSPKCHDYERHGAPDPISVSFWSNLEGLIDPARVSAWIYGHTHSNLRFEINGVPVVTNQRGYPGELDPDQGYDPGYTIEILGPRPASFPRV